MSEELTNIAGENSETSDTEIVEEIEVETVEEIEIDIDEAMGWTGGDNTRHYSLLGRNDPNQHEIKAITGLRDELDDIEALQTVYSDKIGVANYYKWNSGAYDDAGYFVSIVPNTDTIEICEGSDIFGVVVDAAGFVGGQDGVTLDYIKGLANTHGATRDNTYGLVVTSGLVDVRCELDVEVGDCITSNAWGYAKKSGSNYGYKVLALEDKGGVEYAVIMLGVQADITNILGEDLDAVKDQVDANYKNIISAVNIANQAYQKVNKIDASNQEMSDKIDGALDVVDKIESDVDNLETQISNSALVSAQAKAIAESAATSAESMKNEAVEKANEALAETSELRKELDAKVAEIDTDLENTALELQATKESIESTRDELQSNINDVSAELENTKTDLNTARDELSTDIDNTKTELNITREQLQSSIDSTSSELSKTKEKLSETTSSFEELKEDLTPLTAWPDAENPTGVAGFVARADKDSATLSTIVTWQGDTNASMAAFKQEVKDTYATIDSVTQLETDTSNAITAVKQEASEKYATIESVTSLETETSDAITSVKQEVANTYATIESVTKLEIDTSTAIAGVKQEASEKYATIESVTSLKTETSDAIAGVKQEASEKYATIESVTSLDTKTSEAIAGVKQEVAETYATIESVVSLETDTSKSIATFKQEVQDNYATQAMLTEVNDSLTSFKQEVESDYAKQEMVTTVDNALTSYKQEVATNYATQQSVTAVNDSLVKFKQEAADTYATQEMVASVGDNLASFQQKVEDNYATQEMVTGVDNALTAYKQEVEKDYATQQMLSAVEENLASYKQEVTNTYATQQMVTAVDDNLTSYKQEVGKTYATQEMVAKLETDTSKALADYKQEVQDEYATQEMVTKLETDTSKALTDYKQEVADTYATQTSLTTLRTDTTNAIAASEEKATKTYASKSDLTTFEGNTNIAMARIEQKADANGAYIQSTVSNMDKYSVGPYSQAYGFTLEQATSVLEEGMIYVPTVNKTGDDKESYSYTDTDGSTKTSTREFLKGYLYQWGKLPSGLYGWITVDKDYTKDVEEDATADPTKEINISAMAVYFSTTEIAISDSNNYGYWYTNGDTITNIDGTTGTYDPYTLYKWDLPYKYNNGTKDIEEYHWVAVATLAGNSSSRAVSQVRQDTNSVEARVTNTEGDVVSVKADLSRTDATVQTVASWKSKVESDVSNIASIKSTADAASASIAQVVEAVGDDGEVTAASIVTAVNKDTSGVTISADHIKLNGAVTISALDSNVAGKLNNSVASTTIEYALSDSSTVEPTSDWSTTAPDWEEDKYMWQKTTITYTDTTKDATITTTCIQGAKGEDGVGINSTTVSYGVSDSSSVQPEDWTADMPTVAEGQYLWTRTITDYTDTSKEDTITYTYAKQGRDGEKGDTGAAGTSVTVSSIQYQTGTSATTAPTGDWSDSVVTVAEGRYLWSKTTFSDGNVVYGVAKQGVSGEDAYTIVLTNESHTFAGANTSYATGNQEATTQIIAYKGSTSTSARIVSVNGVAASTNKTDTGITGLSFRCSTVNAATSPWITFTTGGTLLSTTRFSTTPCSIPIVVMVDGKSFTKTFSCSIALKGSTGSSATSYWMTTSDSVIHKAKDGTISPTTLTLSGKYKTGTGSVSSYAGRWVVSYSTDGENYTNLYTSTANESSVDITVNPSYRIIRCQMYLSGGTTTLLDEQTIPIVGDGNGVTGVVAQYCVSTSDATEPTDGWTSDFDAMLDQYYDAKANSDETYYIWSREQVTYSDGSTSHSTATVNSASSLIASWCDENNKTLINGANIATGTLDASQITTGSLGADVIYTGTLDARQIIAGDIESKNYVSGTSGTKISLDDGTIDTAKFKVDSEGQITASGGTVGGWNIVDDAIYSDTSPYVTGMCSVYDGYGTDGLTFNGSEVTGYTGSATNVYIPMVHNGSIIMSIRENAFKNSTSIVSVVIPSSVTSIGSSAFYGCTSLASVTICDGVETIGSYAFRGCTSLESITIPPSVKDMGNNPFEDTSIVEVDGGVSYVDKWVVGCDTSVTSIKLRSDTMGISRVAFSGVSMQSLIVPEGVKYISQEGFGNMYIKTVTFPSSIVYVGSSAFWVSYNTTVYVPWKSKPDGWEEDWSGPAVVVWGSVEPPTIDMSYRHQSLVNDGAISYPRFYAGASCAGHIPTTNESAKFLVLEDGSLYAEAADITGTIRATGGEFNGKICATDGDIGGLSINNGIRGYVDGNQSFSLTTEGLVVTDSSARIEVGNFEVCDNDQNITLVKANGPLCICGTENNNIVSSIELMTTDGADTTQHTISLYCTAYQGTSSKSAISIQLKSEPALITTKNFTVYYQFSKAVVSGTHSYDDATTYSIDLSINGGSTESSVVSFDQEVSGFWGTFIRFKCLNDNWIGDVSLGQSMVGSIGEFGTINQETSNKSIAIMGNVVPKTTNTYSLGSNGGPLWSVVYAQTTTISHSDKNKKNSIENLTHNYRTIFDHLKPVSYKLNDNTSDRTHLGFIAQDVKESILNAGLTTQDFAGYCEWTDENGEETCGLRYSEFIALCVDQIQCLKSRVSELEAKLAAIDTD